MKKYGYVRSNRNSEAVIERQITRLKSHNVDEIIIASSEDDILNLIEKLQAGDNIYVESIERLTRNFCLMLEIIRRANKKDITLLTCDGSTLELFKTWENIIKAR